MDKQCRWINLTVPGFDGMDERRGTYSGSMRDLSILIVRLMENRGVKKIIYCGHSMGNIFMSYFATHYSQYIEGIISITGILDTWYTGLKTFHNAAVIKNNLNRMT